MAGKSDDLQVMCVSVPSHPTVSLPRLTGDPGGVAG